MTKRIRHTILLFTFLFACLFGYSQTDTSRRLTPADTLVRVDTLIQNAPPIEDRAKADSVRRAFSPKKATIRSAILPGWGQAYNKKYWKIPIVYGALGVAGGIFIWNVKNYKELRFAYAAKYKASLPGATAQDSVDYFNIAPSLVRIDMNSLRSFRDEFRANVDLSVLAFILIWGLNVVDATVDAHLKAFDVSPDLSFKIKFGPSQMAGTTGLSFVLAVR